MNPDPYRGIFGSDGAKYARDVHDLIQFGTSGQVAGFIGESIQAKTNLLYFIFLFLKKCLMMMCACMLMYV